MPGAQPFGNPTATTAYDLCVFDASGFLFGAAVPPDGTCGHDPCWRAKSTGFSYRDQAGAADGIRKIDLATRRTSTKVTVVGKGPNLALPASLAGVAPPLVVQLAPRTSTACWQGRFDFPTVRATRWKARQ